VLGQLAGCRARPVGLGGLGQGARQPPVHRLPLARQQGRVDRLGEQGVAEPVGAGRLVGHEHAVLDRLLERGQQPRLRQVDDGGQQRVGHVAPGGGGDPQHHAGLGVELGDPPQQQVVEGARQPLARQPRGQQLLGEEGIALGARLHGGGQLGRLLAGQARDQQRHLVAGQRRQLQQGRRAGAAQLAGHPRQRVARARLVAAVGGQQQDVPPGDGVGEEGDQVQG
jgi:hypothetical protein